METILQSLTRIENKIYSVSYDDLTPYLQGVRDMINLVNGEEPAGDIADTILDNLKRLENYYE
jgi:hypothetical protein